LEQAYYSFIQEFFEEQSFRPMVPLVPEKQPDLAGNPVYISAGMTDPIVVRSETETSEDASRVQS